MVASRRCQLRSARRRPVIESERSRPWISKLDVDPDRPYMAGPCLSAVGCTRPSTVGRHRALAMAACEVQRPFAFLVRPADHRPFRSYKCPPYRGRRTAASVEGLGQQTTRHGRSIYGPTGRRCVCDCAVVSQVCLLKLNESGWPDERRRVRAGHSSGKLARAAGRRSTQPA